MRVPVVLSLLSQTSRQIEHAKKYFRGPPPSPASIWPPSDLHQQLKAILRPSQQTLRPSAQRCCIHKVTTKLQGDVMADTEVGVKQSGGCQVRGSSHAAEEVHKVVDRR